MTDESTLLDKVPETKVVKLPKTPKEPRFRKGLNAEQWAAKLASMTVAEVPAGFVGMAVIVKAARDAGIKVSRICTAMGGDRSIGEAWDPIFQVVYVGGRKFASEKILTDGFALLNDPEYHKAAHKGRAKKEKPADGEQKETAVQIKKKSPPWQG
jgi:hypothetical protein